MICRHCGTDIAEKAIICYRCGTATREPRVKPRPEGSIFDRPRRSRLPAILVVIAIIIVLIAAWIVFSGGSLGSFGRVL